MLGLDARTAPMRWRVSNWPRRFRGCKQFSSNSRCRQAVDEHGKAAVSRLQLALRVTSHRRMLSTSLAFWISEIWNCCSPCSRLRMILSWFSRRKSLGLWHPPARTWPSTRWHNWRPGLTYVRSNAIHNLRSLVPAALPKNPEIVKSFCFKVSSRGLVWMGKFHDWILARELPHSLWYIHFSPK